MYFWSISKAAKAAGVKAWRITIKAGKGYEIATDAEIFAKYGELCKGFKCATVRDNKPEFGAFIRV
jgi:hypothetical protein